MASQWGFALVAQWIGRPPSKRMVVGSNPIQGAFPLVRGFLARAGNPSNKGYNVKDSTPHVEKKPNKGDNLGKRQEDVHRHYRGCCDTRRTGHRVRG